MENEKDEIEITAEMIKAGALALAAHDRETTDPDEGALTIWTAMFLASPHGRPSRSR